jgi:uncharacterized membrane protein
MAIGEMVNDKLPKTPSCMIPPQFMTRLVTGSLCGSALDISTGHFVPSLLAGAFGSIVGTLGGAKARAAGANLAGRDLPGALIEDGISVLLALAALSFM